MQHQGTADPQTAQEVRAYTDNYIERFNKNDATAIAALFTEDAVLVSDRGPLAAGVGPRDTLTPCRAPTPLSR